MSRLNDSHLPFSLLQFYATAPYACSYLPGERARSQVATPSHLINTEVYGELVRSGFRRSGVFTYRPRCDDCRACVPVRIPASRFQANRSQRRSVGCTPAWWRANCHCAFVTSITSFTCAIRRQDTPVVAWTRTVTNSTRISCCRVVSIPAWSSLPKGGVLRMVSILDVLDDGLSSVYTFYDPDAPTGEFRHLQHRLADCPVRRQRSALPVPGLLDPRQPEDGLQGELHPHRGTDRRAMDRSARAIVRPWNCYKELLKQERRPEWVDGLAASYAGRAQELTEQGHARRSAGRLA
jgi:hypothetical protein